MSDEIHFQRVELIVQAHVHFQIIAVEREINLDVNENFDWGRFNHFLESSRTSLDQQVAMFRKSSYDVQDIEDIYKDVNSQYQVLTHEGIEEEVREIEEEETIFLEEGIEEDQEKDSEIQQESNEDNSGDGTKGERVQQANKIKNGTESCTKMSTKSAPTGHRDISSETNGREVKLNKSSNEYSKHQKANDVHRPNKMTTNYYHESWYTNSQVDTGYEYNSKRSILVTGIPIMIRDPNWLSQLFKEQNYCHKKEMFIATSTRLAYTPCVETTSWKQDPISDPERLQSKP